MTSRFKPRHRVTTIVAVLAAVASLAIALAAVTASPAAATEPPTECANPTAPKHGWNVYSSQMQNPNHIAAIKAYHPTFIRWMVEWDMYHTQAQVGVDPSPPDMLVTGVNHTPTAAGEAVKALMQGPCPAVLSVQLLVKGSMGEGGGLSNGWMGEGLFCTEPTGLFKGTEWARPVSYNCPLGSMYPKDTKASYGVFVNKIADDLMNLNIAKEAPPGEPTPPPVFVDKSRIVFEAWNEPEWKTGGAYNCTFLWFGCHSKEWNSVNPWNVTSQVDRPKFAWSGGAQGKWTELHQVLDIPGSPGVSEWPWATNGISHETGKYRFDNIPGLPPGGAESWVGRTSKIPEITQLDIHAYSQPTGIVNWVCTTVKAFDSTANPGQQNRPFFVGESGNLSAEARQAFTGTGDPTVPVPNGLSAYDYAARNYWGSVYLREEAAKSGSRLHNRYLGMATHNAKSWEFAASGPLDVRYNLGEWWDRPGAGQQGAAQYDLETNGKHAPDPPTSPPKCV